MVFKIGILLLDVIDNLAELEFYQILSTLLLVALRRTSNNQIFTSKDLINTCNNLHIIYRIQRKLPDKGTVTICRMFISLISISISVDL